MLQRLIFVSTVQLQASSLEAHEAQPINSPWWKSVCLGLGRLACGTCRWVIGLLSFLHALHSCPIIIFQESTIHEPSDIAGVVAGSRINVLLYFDECSSLTKAQDVEMVLHAHRPVRARVNCGVLPTMCCW